MECPICNKDQCICDKIEAYANKVVDEVEIILGETDQDALDKLRKLLITSGVAKETLARIEKRTESTEEELA